ncbi:MAG: sugar ABC transporter permease [Lachnospiraceae bacterium]|nr:sugar ABC transporter permease [Lachnospiraceae bacterium]
MKKKLSHGTKWNLRCLFCIVPSFLGCALFFLIPYIRVLYYSVINNQFQKKFVGPENYVEVMENEFFQLAMKNSLLLIGIGVPVLMGLSLTLSFLLSFSLRRFSFLRDFFIFPMLVPTAAVVIVWREFFATSETALPIYALFVWKNLGLCIILLTAALTTIDEAVYEAARLDGAKPLRLHLQISIPLIAPTILFTLLLAIMNTFKIFKESFLFYGSKYPPNHSYTLQYYMNNNFQKFDYQSLASASVLTSLLVLVIVLVGLSMQRRVQS